MGSSALYAWLTGGGLGCCRSDLVMGLGLVVIIVWAFVFLIFKLFRYNKWAKDFENRLVSYLQEVHTPLDIFKNSKGISRLQGRVFSSWIKSLIYRGLVAGEIDLRNGIYKPKDIS